MEGNNIDHFLHGHHLTLVEEVKHEILCNGCRKSLSSSRGPIYGCDDCKFYLHKPCAELPKEIQNSFHTCPLLLDIYYFYQCNACFEDGYGFTYCCESCNFHMHVECARRERPNIITSSNGDCDEEVIEHFTHWHPLRIVAKKDLVQIEVGCIICGKVLVSSSDPADSCAYKVYGCEGCKFFVHKSCIINIPQKIISHSFHPSCSFPCSSPLILLTTLSVNFNCDGCNDDISASNLIYRCGNCRFRLDLKCALLPTLEDDQDADEVQYVAHPHPLVAFRDNNSIEDMSTSESQVQCVACREKCLSVKHGAAACFGCERCQFYIHSRCAVELEAESHHYYHPHHPLTLSSPQSFQCGACSRSNGGEFQLAYACYKCSFYLHLDCAKPKSKLKKSLFLLKYEGHSHYLELFDKTNGMFCDICGQVGGNCLLQCVACDFSMHIYCHPSAPKKITHHRHSHPLTLAKSPFEFELISPEYHQEEDSDGGNSEAYHFYCDVCEQERYQFDSVYYCQECKFIAEPACVININELLSSRTREGQGGVIVSEDEDEEKTLETRIANRKVEIAQLRKDQETLKSKIEQLKALEDKLTTTEQKLTAYENDCILWTRDLNYYKRKKKMESKCPSDLTLRQNSYSIHLW